MASSKTENGMWTCTAGEMRNFERLLGRRFSAQDIRAADDEAVLAAWKGFRQSLEARGKTGSVARFEYFTSLADADVPAEHQATLAKYRKLAEEHGVADSVPLCYRVRAGFTLKRHAPQAGPCYKNFQYLQDWNFEDKPTQDCLVFWVPRLIADSTSKTVDEQRQLLAYLRQRLELPEHHLVGFGETSLVAGLILAHFKATGERVPLSGLYARTDTCGTDGYRLGRGYFVEFGLDCGFWLCDDERDVNLGVFALGVVLGS